MSFECVVVVAEVALPLMCSTLYFSVEELLLEFAEGVLKPKGLSVH